MVIYERSCVGVKDPNGCKRPAVLSEKVLHGCERPVVLSEKSVWVLETRGVIRKVLLPKRKHTVMFIT